MRESILKECWDFEEKGQYFEAFNKYTEIWAKKLYKGPVFNQCKDEVNAVAYLDDKIILGSRDGNIYLLLPNFTLFKKIKLPGSVILLKAVKISENRSYVLILIQEPYTPLQDYPGYPKIKNKLLLLDSNFTILEKEFPVKENENILCAHFVKKEYYFIVIGTDKGNIYLFYIDNDERAILVQENKPDQQKKIFTIMGIDYNNDGIEEIIAGGVNRLLIIDKKEKITLTLTGIVTNIFPKKRLTSQHLEGIFFISNNSRLQFLQPESEEIQTLAVFPADPLCVSFYDIDQDEGYEILVGCANHKIYLLTENGEVRREIEAPDEVRDMCILPKQKIKPEIHIITALGNNQVIMYDCVKNRYLKERINICFTRWNTDDELTKLRTLLEFDPESYSHLHEFAVDRLKRSLKINKEMSVELLLQFIKKNTDCLVSLRSINAACDLLKIDFRKGEDFFAQLLAIKNKYLKHMVFRRLTDLLNESGMESDLRTRIIKLMETLNNKWNAPLEINLLSDAKSSFQNKNYKDAFRFYKKLSVNNLDLLWKPFKLGEEVPIIKIYTKDINGDNLDEILFRAKNGYLYCLNYIGERVWEYDTRDMTHSLSASTIINKKFLKNNYVNNPMEIIYGTALGEIFVLDFNKNKLFNRYFTEQGVDTIASVSNKSIRLGLQDGSIIAYEYVSNELQVDNKWFFKAQNRIQSIFAYDLLENGIKELIVGSKDKHVYVLQQNGEVLSKIRLNDSICTLYVPPLNSPGVAKIYACCRNGEVIPLSLKKRELIRDNPINIHFKPVFLYYICDIDQDGFDEIVFIYNGNQLFIYDLKGTKKAQYYFEHTVTAINFVSRDFEGYANLIVGFENGVLACYRICNPDEIKSMINKCEKILEGNTTERKKLVNIYQYDSPLEFNDKNTEIKPIFNSDFLSSPEKDWLKNLKNQAENQKMYFSIINGYAKTGKTTLLNYLYTTIPFHSDTVPLLIDFANLKYSSIENFFFSIARIIFILLKEKEFLFGFKYEKRDFQENPFNIMGAFLDGCFQMLRGKRLLIFCDNIDTLYNTSIGKEIIEFLHKKALRHHIIFIFTAAISIELLENDLNLHLLKINKYKLFPFSYTDILELIHRSRDFPLIKSDTASMIQRITKGVPCLVQLTLYHLIEYLNENPNPGEVVDIFSGSLFANIIDAAQSYFIEQWHNLSLTVKLYCSLVATYAEQNNTEFSIEDVTAFNEVSPYVLDSAIQFEEVSQLLYSGETKTFFNVWIKEYWAFPKLLLNEMKTLGLKIPISQFHSIETEFRLVIKPSQLNEFFRNIELDRFIWTRLVAISEYWANLQKENANTQLVCEEIIREIIHWSDFTFYNNEMFIKNRGGIYYMKVEIGKKTLSRESFICIIPETANKDQLINNINTIRNESTSTLSLVFAFFEKEGSQIEEIKKYSRWTICITPDKLKSMLFSENDITDTCWDLALDQVDISHICPYSTTEKAIVTFVGREKEIKKITENLGKNYVLMGGRLIGKTSLIHRIIAFLRNIPGVNIIHLNCDPVVETPDNSNLYDKFLAEINSIYEYGVKSIPEFFHKLREIQRKENKITILLLDEVDNFIKYDQRLENDSQFLRNFHAVYENEVCSGIFAGYVSLYESREGENTPTLSLYEEIRLSFLDDMDAKKLILEPLSDLRIRFKNDKKEKYLEEILSITSHHPSYIQSFCRTLVEYLSARNQRVIDKKIIQEIGNDPWFWEFVDLSFLKGKVITKFEKIIIHCMLPLKDKFTIDDIDTGLKAMNLPFSYSQKQLEKAKDHLILANIFEQEKNQYKFRNPDLFKKILSLHTISSILERGNYFGYSD